MSATSAGAAGGTFSGAGVVEDGVGDGFAAAGAVGDRVAAVAGAGTATTRARPSAATAIRVIRAALREQADAPLPETHIGYGWSRSRAAIMTQMTQPFVLPQTSAGLFLPRPDGRP